MKASSVSQSKAGQQAGPQNPASEKGTPGVLPASQAPHGAAELIGSSGPSTPPSSVCWLAHPGSAIRIIAALTGGLVLRLWMMSAFPQNGGDALIYGNLGKSLLLHGQFALTDGSGVIHPTLIRLPGYPLFLAACFCIFGIENYHAVAWLQIGLELAACLLLADFVRNIRIPRAGLNTLWLAAMCPFTAVYASAPLTESLTLDTICLALWALQRYHGAFSPTQSKPGPDRSRTTRWVWLLLFTLALSYAALLRPDGALLAIALWPALLFARSPGTPLKPALRNALLCALLSILPFTVWTARNWRAFHVFEPLAPRYATDPGEDPHPGWQHWVKTWCLDFTCTSEIYWNVPDNPLALEDLPTWAIDSPNQQQRTIQLIEDYNQDQQITPEIDARFEALARERAATHPRRTHLLLPLGRLADMTLRPRVENLTIDLRWWQYRYHRSETRFSVAYAAVNLLFLLLGIAGFFYRPRFWRYVLAYLVLRSLLLLTIEAPETRYTLEFFPMLFALGGIALQNIFKSRRPNPDCAA
jgi:hypothetical protein